MRVIKFLFCVLFFFSQFLILSAQNGYKITGTVKDNKDKSPLIGANIAVKARKSNEIITGTVADLNGSFILKNIAPDAYNLEISYVGYNTDTIKIRVKDADINLNNIFLTQDASLLKEFEIISTQTRMEIKGDTIEHKADAYKSNPDATAEDLVKKLPGVTTDGNTMKVDGEEVKKILVDGKPFFSDDPTATLRNLPADIVDNIQMFDFMSEQSQFTGFRDGNEEKTINLNTKKGTNVGQFGKAYAGYGPDDKYNAGVTLNSFNGSQRISLIGMTNNVNQQNFNISDIMSVMSNASDQGGRSPGRGRPGGSSFQTNQQSGITKTNAIGINYNDIWGRKIKISGSYFYNQTRNSNSSTITRNYFTENNLQYDEINMSETNNSNHRLNIKLEYVIDSLNKITLTPRLTIQENLKKNNENGINSLPLIEQIVSSSDNNTVSKNLGINFNNDLLYQHKFKKKGRTLSFNLNTQANNRSGDGSLYTSSLYEDTATTSTIIDRTYLSGSNQTTLGGNLSYTEPLKKNMQLMLTYRPTYKINDADKTTKSADSTGTYSITDTLLSNLYSNTSLSQRGGLSFGLNTKKINFTMGTDFEQTTLNGLQTFPDDLKVDKIFNSILPAAYFNYKFSRTFNLNTNFRSNTRIPEISQLQNVVDISNPLFVKAGNPNLKQTFENRLTIRLTKRMPDKERHFMLFVMGNKTDNYISNATYILSADTTVQNVLVNKGSQLSIPWNLSNFYNIRTFGVFGLPVNKIKCNLNFNAGYSFTQTPALINNSLNYSKNNAFNAGIYLSSNISEYFDFSLSYNGSYSIVKNTLQTQTDNIYLNHAVSFKGNAILFKKLVFNTDISQTYYTGLSDAYNQSFTLWNAFIGYKFQKKQTLEIKLSVNDILNQNTSINRTTTETYTEDALTKVLNRYALLTLTYTFKNFKNGVTGPEEIKLPKGMPPPGRMGPPPPH